MDDESSKNGVSRNSVADGLATRVGTSIAIGVGGVVGGVESSLVGGYCFGAVGRGFFSTTVVPVAL